MSLIEEKMLKVAFSSLESIYRTPYIIDRVKKIDNTCDELTVN